MNNVLPDLGANLHATWMTNQFAVRARSRIDVSFFFFFFLLLPPSFFSLHLLIPEKCWCICTGQAAVTAAAAASRSESEEWHPALHLFFVFHWLIFHTLTPRQTRTSRHLLTFVRILFTDKSEALIDVYESFLPSRKGRRRDWRENVFYIIWDENLFTASVPRDRVRVYCKSNIFPRVRDIEQDRL